MAAGDHYLITLRGHHDPSLTQIQNAFVYVQQEGTGNAARLNVAFLADVVATFAPVMSVAYVMDDLYTVNLDDPADYNTLVIGTPGDITSDALPLFVTYAFEFVRPTRAIQNGRKALGIVPESMQSNGTASAPALVILDNIATAMESEIDDAVTTSSWRPQLWRRPGTYDSGVVTAPGLFYDVDSVRFVRISTQNTRKIGRGS